MGFLNEAVIEGTWDSGRVREGLTLPQACGLFHDALEGLGKFHEWGISINDIKSNPDNAGSYRGHGVWFDYDTAGREGVWLEGGFVGALPGGRPLHHSGRLALALPHATCPGSATVQGPTPAAPRATGAPVFEAPLRPADDDELPDEAQLPAPQWRVPGAVRLDAIKPEQYVQLQRLLEFLDGDVVGELLRYGLRVRTDSVGHPRIVGNGGNGTVVHLDYIDAGQVPKDAPQLSIKLIRQADEDNWVKEGFLFGGGGRGQASSTAKEDGQGHPRQVAWSQVISYRRLRFIFVRIFDVQTDTRPLHVIKTMNIAAAAGNTPVPFTGAVSFPDSINTRTQTMMLLCLWRSMTAERMLGLIRRGADATAIVVIPRLTSRQTCGMQLPAQEHHFSLIETVCGELLVTVDRQRLRGTTRSPHSPQTTRNWQPAKDNTKRASIWTTPRAD
ncbi:unnamed protein product [Vitrella brassicaformis CCMP3155]|uniref:Uncharacterized protein n=1 Tax=Vitrella brassicaformis (strain CCMP3155) TaxID=1169540 RepID=A0A0G4G161_VITBC|nr:unnamed protein product [Vitrella brassicaformis CCMP3155]|eukprot:CEM21728.1 unnamed protein product [Vitrella brassicaformis CCMP3155]